MDRDALHMLAREGYESVAQFANDVHGYLNKTFGLTTEQADVIYRYAWDKGHSSGFSEIFSIIEDITTMLEQLGFVKEMT